jgi:ribosomal protein L44E
MTASNPVTEVKLSPSSTRYDQTQQIARADPNSMQRAKTTKKVVLRLECTQCKTKAQVGIILSTCVTTANS